MRFARLNYFFDFALCPPLIAYFAHLAWRARVGDVLFGAALWCLAGLALWTFIEYWVHRTLFHHAPILREMHGAHHRQPELLAGSPPAILPLALIALAFALFGAFGPAIFAPIQTGLLTGYLFYSFMHYAAHHVRSRRLHYLVALKHWHMRHHFGPQDKNFGVTTAFWDHVFGTALDTRAPSRSRRVAG